MMYAFNSKILSQKNKNTSCSYKASGFNYQQPHNSSQPHITPASYFCRHYTYMDTYLHEGKTLININLSLSLTPHYIPYSGWGNSSVQNACFTSIKSCIKSLQHKLTNPLQAHPYEELHLWIIRMLYSAFKFVFIMCVCACACGGQNNLWESILSLYHVRSWVMKLRSSGWVSGPFNHQPTLWPLNVLCFLYLSSFQLQPTLLYPHLSTVLQTDCIYFLYT